MKIMWKADDRCPQKQQVATIHAAKIETRSSRRRTVKRYKPANARTRHRPSSDSGRASRTERATPEPARPRPRSGKLIRRRRIFQPHRLQLVPRKQKSSHQETRTQRGRGKASELTMKTDGQHQRRQAHADSIETGGEISASAFLMMTKFEPQIQSDQNQKYVGFEGAGHGLGNKTR